MFSLVGSLLASDFKPNPTWVTHPDRTPGYTIYEDYQAVPSVELEALDFDSSNMVRFSNLAWRGATSQFLAGRIKDQTILGKPCSSAVLLRNADKWIELGRAPVDDPNHPYKQAFLLFEWDSQGGGVRKSTFSVNAEVGTLKLGEVIEVGNGLAVVKMGIDIHDWVDLVILDLNTFRPKGMVSFSNLEIANFTFGRELKIRYKRPVTRAQILSNENAVEELAWENLDIVTKGVLNPDVVDESKFQISIPAVQ